MRYFIYNFLIIIVFLSFIFSKLGKGGKLSMEVKERLAKDLQL